MSFDIYGNRDESSGKLRAQNQQILSKEKTKHLEMETAKMAERLAELKIAMSREKEERERTVQSGGFWQSGQVGSLGSYPKEVLAKSAKPNDQLPKKKITVLKDEPIVLPERYKGPGTMALMIKQQPLTTKSAGKIKGRRCGQCEEKVAHVTCSECGEDYCAACFAAFHLKGALKKHRSTPIGSGALRTPRADINLKFASDDCKENVQQMSQNRKGEKVSSSASLTEEEAASSAKKRNDLSKGDRAEIGNHGKTVVPSSQQRKNFSEGESLLDGTYDPVENQRQFQEALLEWRQGGKAPEKESSVSKLDQPNSSRANVGVETMTNVTPQPAIEIRFSGSSLTYAERLMLKKHRRMELGAAPSARSSATPGFDKPAAAEPRSTPVITDVTDEEKLREPGRGVGRSVDGGSVAAGGKDDLHTSKDDLHTSKDDLHTSSASVRFKVADVLPSMRRSGANESEIFRKSDTWKQSQADRKASSARMSSERKKFSRASNSQLQMSSEQPRISVVELKKPLSKKDPVKLDRSTTSVGETRGNYGQANKRQISSKPRVRKDAFGSPSEGGDDHSVVEPREQRPGVVVTRTSVEAFDAPRRPSSSSKTSVKSKGDAPNGAKNLEKLLSHKPISEVTSESESRAVGEFVGQSEEEHNGRSTGKQTRKKPASRPSSRTTSRQGPRPKSQAGSRPVSRIASYRDVGCITKTASEALKSVARLSETGNVGQNTDLGAYFTMAVHPDRTGVMTPVSSRSNAAHDKGRMRVSNALYQIGPRSWKPESSFIQPSVANCKETAANEDHRIVKKKKKKKKDDSETLSWTLSQQLSSNGSLEKPDRMKSTFANERTSSIESFQSAKLSLNKTKSDLNDVQKILPKTDDHQSTGLKFSKDHPSVTPNMMVPQSFRRPGSGFCGPNSARSQPGTGRESQFGSITGRESQVGSRTGRESQAGLRTGRESQSGRESQMIIYDGTDLSVYEEKDFAEQRRQIEEEARKRLDMEIVTESGINTTALNNSSEYSRNVSNESPESRELSSKTVSNTYHKLRESSLMSDFEEMEAKMMADYEEEVKALK